MHIILPFSFLTCGIYSIYWMIKLNDEVNQLAGEPQATSGGMVFLFSLITCGIYGIYWAYKMGERCDRIIQLDHPEDTVDAAGEKRKNNCKHKIKIGRAHV